MINETTVSAIMGISFLIVAYFFYDLLMNRKRQFENRMKEIDIAQNMVKSFKENADNLFKSDALPKEAKKLLLFIGNLLIDEKEAARFLSFMNKELDNKKGVANESDLYRKLLLATKDHPEILEDFSVAIRDGLIAVMFKWPNQSGIFYKQLSKVSTKTSNEVRAIQVYSNNKQEWDNKLLVAC